MLFEGELSHEILMLVYLFCIIIIFYVVVALFLYLGHRKGKSYEKRRQQEQLKNAMDPSTPQEKSNEKHNDT